MPPKLKFDLARVIETAFMILKERGWAAVSARSIGEALNASTMPVYSSIGSMKNLEQQLKKKTYMLLAEYQSRQYTENELLNLAVGQVLFARDNSLLYKFLYIDSPARFSSAEEKELDLEVTKRLGHPIPFETYFGQIDVSSIDAISLKGWIFVHGLSMALMNGNLQAMSDKKIINLLEEAGAAFFTWEKSKNNLQSTLTRGSI